MYTNHSTRPKQHVVTVALEDYFQVGSFNHLIQRGQWYRFDARFERNTLQALQLLDRFNVKATFFVLGWIAETFPEIVRMVAERGHEIASKGYYHRSIRQMAPSEFREDLQRSRAALERASGRKVVGYRVAHEWFKPNDLWALDVLAKEGYAYDSSIGLLFRRFANEPWRRFMHKHVCGTKELWEFPLSSTNISGFDVPIAGGNYFRQFPHRLVKQAVENWHQNYQAPFVMYFHVWELDPDQPKINTPSWLTRIRHYRNLDKMAWVLEYYFQRYSFTGIARYLGLADEPAQYAPKTNGHARPASLDLAQPAEETTTDRIPLTVVVPCYNEELILPYMANTLANVKKTLGRKYDVQFVFVDDCSKDDTWPGLHKTFSHRADCTVLHHEQNRGVTGAILTGINHAKSEIVCSIDADCTYDPLELTKMIPLLRGGVDLVTASPYHPEGRVLNVPQWRLRLSKTCSFLYRRVLPQKLYTYTSCCRVYRRSALLRLDVKETGYLGLAEMVAKLALSGGGVVESPATLEGRMLGRSKMSTFRTIFRHLRLLASLTGLRILRFFAPGRFRTSQPSGYDIADAGVSHPCQAMKAPEVVVDRADAKELRRKVVSAADGDSGNRLAMVDCSTDKEDS
jgi:polysaccharide deacetylase family protein (PEP-CTERM system associated)